MIVAVLHNPAKRGCFTVDERVAMLEKIVAPMGNVTVAKWDGMLVDYVRRTNACAVIRGLRGPQDLTVEMTMAQVNARLLPGLETVFLTTQPEHGCISSSIVREVASFGGDVSGFVPACILQQVRERFTNG